MQGNREIGMAVGVVGPRRDRAAVGADRSLNVVLLLEDDAAIDMRLRERGIDGKRPLASRGRLVEPAEVAQAGAEIVQDGDVGRIDRHDLPIDLDRISKPPGLMQRQREPPQFCAVVRSQFRQIERRHIPRQRVKRRVREFNGRSCQNRRQLSWQTQMRSGEGSASARSTASVTRGGKPLTRVSPCPRAAQPSPTRGEGTMIGSALAARQ